MRLMTAVFFTSIEHDTAPQIVGCEMQDPWRVRHGASACGGMRVELDRASARDTLSLFVGSSSHLPRDGPRSKYTETGVGLLENAEASVVEL